MKDPIFNRKNLRFSKVRPKWALPLIVPWKHKWTAGVFIALLGAIAYFSAHQFPWTLPRQFPLTQIEYRIPLIPETIWIYLSLFVLIPISYGMNRCTAILNRQIYEYIFTIMVSTLCFMIFPITYPRDIFATPIEPTSLTHHILNWIRWIDHPTNCTPSLHVCYAYLIAFGYLEDQKQYFPFAFIWATLLSLSTLTTKQHYIIDVVLGGILALGIHWLFHRVLNYWLPQKNHSGSYSRARQK